MILTKPDSKLILSKPDMNLNELLLHSFCPSLPNSFAYLNYSFDARQVCCTNQHHIRTVDIECFIKCECECLSFAYILSTDLVCHFKS